MTNSNVNTSSLVSSKDVDWDAVLFSQHPLEAVEYNKEDLIASMLSSLEKFLGKSKKESWKDEMREAAPMAAEQIASRLLRERKVYAGGIQINVFTNINKNIQLFRFLVSSAINDGIIQIDLESGNIYLQGNNVIKGVRYPKPKASKKNNSPLGIKDVANILEAMPLYWDTEFTIPDPEDVNLLMYVHQINEGIKETYGELHIPVMNDFRGRIYAKTDVGNYTSDKTQRHHLLIEGMPCIALDSKSSCIQLASIMLRDNVALKKVFTVGNKNHKDCKPYVKIFKKFPQELEKEIKKACVMQFTYGGNSYCVSHLGTDVHEFHRLYKEHLPLVFTFRNACVAGWNDEAIAYSWSLPDGFQVNMECSKPISEIPDYCDTRIELEIAGKRHHIKPFWSINTPLQKGELGTKGIGANLIHSIDAYIMRELVRRCHGQFRTDIESIKIGELKCSANAKAIYDMWVQTKMVSLNILNELKKGDSIPQEYYDAIKDVMLTLPEHSFYIKPIHDEFCCRVEFRNEMVQVYNCLLVELYNSSYAEYAAKELELKLEVGKANPKVTMELFHNDYLLHED